MQIVKHNILLIDDDKAVRESMTAFLTDEGFYTKAVGSGSEGIALIRQQTIPFSLALIDYHMPEINGLEVIKQIRKYNPDLSLLAFSGDDSVAVHNGSLDSGALFFIPKEMADAKLLGVIHRICKEVEKKTKPLSVIDESANSKLIKSIGMIGVSNAMAEVAKQILKFGPTSESVFIRGENGTGKEMVARAIHQNSPRRLQRFIDINCGAISESLIESELFGHIKGSFTGANNDKVGKFQAANGGTIFLDEIGEMPYHLQVKLLRVIQEKAICPVGSNTTKKIDVRIITATNAHLEDMIAKKLFREDLYYRIKVLPITVPALRERPEDIPSLVSLFLKEFNDESGLSKTILESSIDELKKLKWPGNVRELQHLISHLANSTEGNVLDLKNLPINSETKKYSIRKPKDYDSFKFKNINEEKILIEEALRTSPSISSAAHKLGMKRSTLRDKIKKYGIVIEKLSKTIILEEG
jgi:DNA-binding NtrC family response regulator